MLRDLGGHKTGKAFAAKAILAAMIPRRISVSALSSRRASAVSPIVTSPPSGASSAAMQCISVDLPEPDGPMMAVNSPA